MSVPTITTIRSALVSTAFDDDSGESARRLLLDLLRNNPAVDPSAILKTFAEAMRQATVELARLRESGGTA